VKHSCLKVLGNQRGVGAIMGVIMLGVFTGFAALVVDLGFLFVTKTELQNNADLAALAAGAELKGGAQTNQAALIAKAIEYSQKQLLPAAAGIVLDGADVIIGNWNPDSRTFSAGGNPTNAVQVTTRRVQANGNPVNFYFASLLGHQSGDVQATAVAYKDGLEGPTTRFLCDDEMIDTDVPSIEDLAASMGTTSQELLSDSDGDWFIDLPAGATLEVPTGQVGDSGMFDAHSSFPFTSDSDTSFTDFLNYNEFGGWRDNPDVKALLDPLVGMSPVEDPADYEYFVNPDFVQVCPIYKSDISDLGNNEVNALGERRGLLAFKIMAVGEDPDGPGGSVLPNLIIEIADPSLISIDDVLSPDGGKLQLVL